MIDQAVSSPAGSTPLDAFSALVLADHSLQKELLQPDFTGEEKFITRLTDIARQRGFAIAADDVRQAMRPRLPGLEGLLDASVNETPEPPDGWLPTRVTPRAGALYVHWSYFGARRLREPFFESEVYRCALQPPNRLFRYVTSIDKLAAWLELVAQLSRKGGYGDASRSREYEVSSVVIRDATSGRVLQTLIGHTADVTCAAFSPDGRRLATASFDRTIKLWDTATGRDVFTLRGHTAGVVALAFSPDGNRIASGGIDHTARVWDATPLSTEVLRADDDRYRRKIATLEQLKAAEDDAQRAKILASGGQWGMAAEAFARAVEKEPEKIQLRYQLVDALLQAGDRSRVGPACDDILKRFGNNGRFRPGHGSHRGLPVGSASDHRSREAPGRSRAGPGDQRPAAGLVLGQYGQWDLVASVFTKHVEEKHTDDKPEGLDASGPTPVPPRIGRPAGISVRGGQAPFAIQQDLRSQLTEQRGLVLHLRPRCRGRSRRPGPDGREGARGLSPRAEATRPQHPGRRALSRGADRRGDRAAGREREGIRGRRRSPGLGLPRDGPPQERERRRGPPLAREAPIPQAG